MEKLEGVILKGIGGFYYIEVSNSKIYECKARGIFRKRELSPVVGDRVLISIKDEGYASIESILLRKNYLIRPPVANIDKLFIVVSTCDPSPNTLIIDKMTAIARYRNIEPVIVISKIDLNDGNEISSIYKNAGIRVIGVSSMTCEGIDEVKMLLNKGINVFTGNSGVGKSSLLNAMFPKLMLLTGQTSKKLGRGKHTTRHVELFKLLDDGYVVDTPGFSMIDLQRAENIKKEELENCFVEFNDYLGLCKFNSCAHICEKGCAILQAVEDGKISSSRHQSYISMYNEIKDVKEWEKVKK